MLIPPENGSPLIQAMNENFAEIQRPWSSGQLLSGQSFDAVRAFGIGAGTTDLYTAPAGFRVLIGTFFAGKIRSATPCTYYFVLKSGGSYYRLSNSLTSSAVGLLTAASLGGNIILEPGESVGIVCSANAVIDMFGIAIPFSPASGPRMVKVLGLQTGDNLLYAVPAGKGALIGRAAAAGGYPRVDSNSIIGCCSDAGGTRLFGCCIGPAYVSTNPNAVGFISVAASAVGNMNGPGTMIAGEVLTINVDVGNPAQMAWTLVAEI